MASVSNTGAIFLNGDSFSLSSPFYSLDDSGFFGFPASLAAGQTFTGELFSVTNNGIVAGAYNGQFSILGGADATAMANLATATFQSGSVAITPEPASLLLLVTGAGGIFGVGHRRIAAICRRQA